MSGYKEFVARDRRLAMLRLLIECDGRANESVLEQGLAQLGFSVGFDRALLRADLDFLKERDLVRVEWFQDKIAVAHIRKRGDEFGASTGEIKVEGIKPPSLGE